jgi:hypothetical protein
MDDWKSRGLKPWMLRLEVGLLITVVLVIAVAYVLWRVAPS